MGTLNFQAVLRESDNSIQFNYGSVVDPLAVPDGNDQPVGSFTRAAFKKAQMWRQTPMETTSWSGNPTARTAVRVAFTDGGTWPTAATWVASSKSIRRRLETRGAPKIAMTPTGRFVVTWTGQGPGDTNGVFARIYGASGVPLTDEFRVHRNDAGSQSAPDVGIDAAGNFIVTWQGEGSEDVDGVYLRRFTADGQPLGLVDEIKRITFQGPPLNGSTFTLVQDGVETGTIVFSTNPNQLAQRIENAPMRFPISVTRIRWWLCRRATRCNSCR